MTEDVNDSSNDNEVQEYETEDVQKLLLIDQDIESDEDFHEKNEGTSLHASSVDIEEIEFLKTVKLAADKKFCRVEDLPPEIAEAVNKLNPNLNVKSIIKKKQLWQIRLS